MMDDPSGHNRIGIILEGQFFNRNKFLRQIILIAARLNIYLSRINQKEISMKVYIGTKIVMATPMNEAEFLNTHKSNCNESLGRDGYLVMYPDGYRSWSPKDVFEASYRPILDDEFDLLLPPPELSEPRP
jgi:hypothetical protein